MAAPNLRAGVDRAARRAKVTGREAKLRSFREG
jgi:hypothetical protein